MGLLVTGAYAGILKTYEIEFTRTTGSDPLPSGQFTYDTTSQMFTSFTVTWEGTPYDFLGAVSEFEVSSVPSCITGNPNSSIGLYQLLTDCYTDPSASWAFFGGLLGQAGHTHTEFSFEVGANSEYRFVAFGLTPLELNHYDTGAYSVVEVAPEPGSLALLGIGLAAGCARQWWRSAKPHLSLSSCGLKS